MPKGRQKNTKSGSRAKGGTTAGRKAYNQTPTRSVSRVRGGDEQRSKRSPGRPKGEGSDEQRRDEIATAALKLFSEIGFASVSNKELGAAAGVNPALIYYYFKDKQDLFAFAVRKALADAQALYEELRREQGNNGALAAWLSSNVVLSTEFSRFLKVVFDYSFSQEKCSDTDRSIARFYDTEVEILSQAVRHETSVGGARAVELAQLVSVFLDGVMVARVVRPELNPERLVDLMRELLGASEP